MKKIFGLFILGLVLFFSLYSASHAHNAEKHNQELRCVLFGPSCKLPNDNNKTKTAIQKLYKASYLAIDQFNGKGVTTLRELEEYGIKWLPTNIKKINYTIEIDKHRMYTHRGWSHDYIIDSGHWNVRKMILLSTVNNVFKFGHTTNNPDNYKGQCDSFAALMYYVHILGDHEESQSVQQF